MEKVIVNYVTRRIACPCCSQKLPQPETSKQKQFKISENDVIEWAELETWNDVSESPTELWELVRDFTYEIIHFHAVDMRDGVIIENEELKKVKDFILNTVINPSKFEEEGETANVE